ncbi:TlpA family protein disulfide reductase [Chondromyces crocatus]|uniref:Thioredoxin domain-containing protein n=1 Tax=Chondromyces crocatus TaxID=52 RepID=A0A0K1ERT6_CHOCO|nr:TlpA family protein disulfide reductase [Chondromyces crocatus]AKT43377.1 uncharacterized protein CMC5_076090 [Chondromyces crocatus]
MQKDELVRWAGVGAVGLSLLSGCVSEELAPPFPNGSGQDAIDVAAYPESPYGIRVGSTIANYKFVGYANASEVNDALQEIRLSDFYNPTGEDVYSDEGRDVQYGAGKAKPKALLIVVSSVWCGPCNYEAEKVLPDEYKRFAPHGEFLLQLADGGTPGDPAKQRDLYNWTRKYKVDYPSAIDPSYKLGSLFNADAYPANMIVDTRDMSIVQVVSGSPSSGFWNTFQRVVDGTL